MTETPPSGSYSWFTPLTYRNRAPTGSRASAKDSRRGVAPRNPSKINRYNEQRHLWSETDLL